MTLSKFLIEIFKPIATLITSIFPYVLLEMIFFFILIMMPFFPLDASTRSKPFCYIGVTLFSIITFFNTIFMFNL